MKKYRGQTITALLGEGICITGTLEFKGTVRVDGEVVGNIHSPEGTLVIGEKALINADVSVRTALIGGEVAGTINATEKIEIYPPARIRGDLSAKIIKIEAGACLVGNCNTAQDNIIEINSNISKRYSHA